MILEKDADVQIEIYNSLGQMVVKQINSKLSAGNHFFNFSADDLQNGIYNYVVKINKHNIFMGRMIVLK